MPCPQCDACDVCGYLQRRDRVTGAPSNDARTVRAPFEAWAARRGPRKKLYAPSGSKPSNLEPVPHQDLATIAFQPRRTPHTRGTLTTAKAFLGFTHGTHRPSGGAKSIIEEVTVWHSFRSRRRWIR